LEGVGHGPRQHGHGALAGADLPASRHEAELALEDEEELVLFPVDVLGRAEAAGSEKLDDAHRARAPRGVFDRRQVVEEVEVWPSLRPFTTASGWSSVCSVLMTAS